MARLPRQLVLAAIVSLAAMVAPAVADASDRRYVVQPGDYLYGIAHRHAVPIASLLSANRLTLTSVIHPGQRLTIPSTTSTNPPTATTNASTYSVRPGDYLYGIARRHAVPIASLLIANRLTLTSVIHPGQRLTIPSATSTNPPTATTNASTYTVGPGDYLYGIAHRHAVPITALLSANRLTLTSVIHPGQRLTIPSATSSPPSTMPPTRPDATEAPPASPSATGAADVERIIRDVWPDALEQTALEIAWRESRYQPAAESRCCSGLFQIYFDVHKGWLVGLGIDSRADLWDARTNAEAAFALYRRAGGWAPWALPSG